MGNAYEYSRSSLNTEPNKEYIEKTDARDYARNVLNTKPNSEYIKETNAHDYVQNELNTESARDEKSGDTVNPDCTRISKEDHQITFDLEHVLSKTLDSRNGQKGTNTASKCSSSLSGSYYDKINKSPAPLLEESIQFETSAHFINLFAEIQNDLIKLDYIKNYNNQKHSMTEKSQEYLNSTQEKITQNKYYIVQRDMNNMIISEENLGKITGKSPT